MTPRIIIGLGNPGSKYQTTRHNVGFRAIDELAFGEAFKKESKGLVCKKYLGDRNILLVKPQTFMNLSGECVQSILTRYKIKPQECLVIVDDIQLDEGRIRIRKKGSHGGQNGLRDIVSRVGSDFPRIRMGVGKVPEGYDVSRWVLGVPNKTNQLLIDEAVHKIPKLIEEVLLNGFDKAMMEYNGK